MSNCQNRLFISCRRQHIPFLVDSGASLSVLPNSLIKRRQPNSTPLFAANGSSITTYGTLTARIQLNNTSYKWDIPKAIIGADFLAHFRLMVDVTHRRLVNSQSNEVINGYISTVSSSSIYMINPDNKYADIIHQYLTGTDATASRTPSSVFHHIETTGPPVHAKARRLPPEKLRLAKQEFSKLQDLGIIRPSKSPWSSPLHLVPKANGETRPTGDYLNHL